MREKPMRGFLNMQKWEDSPIFLYLLCSKIIITQKSRNFAVKDLTNFSYENVNLMPQSGVSGSNRLFSWEILSLKFVT
jgi:hypothetical protein